MALTTTERYVVQDVLSRVIDALSWDKNDQEYRDCGNILISLSKSDFQALKLAYKKFSEGKVTDAPAAPPREPRTREKLIALFTFDKGQPYLQYHTLGHARQDWKRDKPVLDAMIKEGLVRISDKTRNTILYKYTPQS